MWHDYNREGMNDFMCTNAVQYSIRDNFIHAYVQMRSNDAVFGYKNDVIWQWEVLTRLKDDLVKSGMTDLQSGGVLWNASSLHVYERHFHLVV
jgi:thymidylate synthase